MVYGMKSSKSGKKGNRSYSTDMKVTVSMKDISTPVKIRGKQGAGSARDPESEMKDRMVRKGVPNHVKA